MSFWDWLPWRRKATTLGPAPEAPMPPMPVGTTPATATVSVPVYLEKAAKIIARYEAFRSRPYMPTPRDRPTIGFGTTRYPDGRAVTLSDVPCTVAQAMGWLEHEISKSDRALTALCNVPLNDNQRAAVLSLIYNIGEGAFSRSTLLRRLNQADYVGAADQFLVWDKQKGVTLPGLATRRRSERSLFLNGET